MFSLPSWLDDVSPDDWEPALLGLLEACSSNEQVQFWDLVDAQAADSGGKTATGILLTNFHSGVSANEEEDGSQGGLFLILSRFNHSCCPNVHHSWNDTEGARVVHALRDIEIGEELSCTYIELDNTHEERQAMLRHSYGFECFCEACSLSGQLRAHSDQRRSELQGIGRMLADVEDPQELGEKLVAELASKAAQLVDEELRGHAQLKCRIFYDAFQLALELGNDDLACEMVSLAWENSVVANGATSSLTLRFQEYAESELELVDMDGDEQK